jgi:hypothetical protein
VKKMTDAVYRNDLPHMPAVYNYSVTTGATIENHNGRLWAAPNDGPGAKVSFSIRYKPKVVPDSQNSGVIRASVDAGTLKYMRATCRK